MLCIAEHDIPACGKGVVELIKKLFGFSHLVNHLKAVVDDHAVIAERAVIADRYLHFLLNGADGIQIFYIIYNVKNDWNVVFARR